MFAKYAAAAALLAGACSTTAEPAADPPAPVAASFDHLALYVADLDRSATFYKTVFGFTETPAPVGFARWLVMGNGVMLHIVRGRPAPADASKWDHFALSCADMDRMIASLDAAGIEWADIEGKRTPQVRADGVKQIFVRDPDGYWVEINDALKPR
jgi:lactoylglutathione lyase